MTITAQDIKLLASARMTDAADGGGQVTGTTLQDGVENNIFPDISSTDCAFGRLRVRKVYSAVWPATGTDTLLGANVVLQDITADPDVYEWVMQAESAGEERADAVRRLEVSHWEPLGTVGANTDLIWINATRLHCAGAVPVPGLVVYARQTSGAYGLPVLLTGVTALGGDDYDVTYAGTWGAEPPMYARFGVPSTTSPRLAATSPVTGTLSIGDTHCDIQSVLVPIVPKHIGAAAGAAPQIGIDAVPVVPEGRAAGFRGGDGLVLHHTTVVAAATYANGDTVNCGRTNLAGVRVADVDGLGLATGWTANLATGIVTINDITGWAQPITIAHTIEEVLACSRTGYPEVVGGSSGGGTTEASPPFTLAFGAELYCGRPNVGRIRVISKTGQDITAATYISLFSASAPVFTVDLAAGTVRFNLDSNSTPSISTFVGNHSPVTLVSSGSYYAPSAPTLPQANINRVTFNRPLTRAFPAGSLCSSMLFLGDLQAQAGAAFAQETWTEVWADARIGPPILPQYQQALHPIVVSNLGAVTERWAIIFTSATAFRVVGETLGQITTGNTSSLLQPINPATGAPYFTLQAAGWGTGWAGGNVLRFTTRGALAASWVARVVLPSPPAKPPDSLLLATRGDIDA